MNYPLVKVCMVLCFCVALIESSGQNGLKKGDALPEGLVFKKVLNNTMSITSLEASPGKLTIIDFFGTWCGPCLRALPVLKNIKDKYQDEVKVILVSNETEEQLAKFIKARNNFSFPIIVDEGNVWNSAFQPPSLPYTVIVKDGKVLAITHAEDITENSIRNWLATAQTAVDTSANSDNKNQNPSIIMSTRQQSSNAIVRLSQDYIYAAKTGASLTDLSNNLASLSYENLEGSLSNDDEKKAFWINLYNGYTQAALSSSPEQYKNRNAFFKTKSIPVAGKNFSLDDIEHGILRHSKVKWSLGHFNKLFPSKTERELRVDTLDYRIHFALNCGAKSCPPIAFYTNENLDAQLDIATKAYLSGEAKYDSATNIIYLPKLMSWFRADFGGKKGMLKILRQHNIITGDITPTIKFSDYDWTLNLNNYLKQNP